MGYNMSAISFNEWLILRENKSNKARVFHFARKRGIPDSIVHKTLEDLGSPPTYSDKPREKIISSKGMTTWKKYKDMSDDDRMVGSRLSGEDGAEVYMNDYVGGKRDCSPEVADKAINMLASLNYPVDSYILNKREEKKRQIQQEKEREMERERRNKEWTNSPAYIRAREYDQEMRDKDTLEYLNKHGTKEDVKDYLKQMRNRDKQ